MEERIYLDNAATTFPKPEAVWRAIDEANRNYAGNVGRGSYEITRKAGELLEETRTRIRDLAGAGEETEVILAPSATLACNQILGGLDWDRKDLVYLSPYEHNAIVRVLHILQKRYEFEIRELPIHKTTLELDIEKIRYQFSQRPPDVLCMTHVSNVTGYILPVEDVVSCIKRQNTTIIIDGSQSLGLVSTTFEEIGADYYIFAGHKTLYGPLGIGGFLCRRPNVLNPVFAGGTGTDSLNPEMPEELPGRYEPGSPNIPAAAGLCAALRELNAEKGKELCERERFLIRELERRLSVIPGVRLYLPIEEKRRSGICSFVIEGYQSEDVGMILDEDYGIAVRCGYQCAPLIHKYLKDEMYGGTIRVSVGQFNTTEEIERFAQAVEEIAGG